MRNLQPTITALETCPLSGQALAALCPTASHNLGAVLGGHAGTITMPALTNEFARLISAFHDTAPNEELSAGYRGKPPSESIPESMPQAATAAESLNSPAGLVCAAGKS